MTLNWKKWMVTFSIMMVGIAPRSFAADVRQPGNDRVQKNGVSVSAFTAPFIGGDSGPETLLSPTYYQDTFGTGTGVHLEGFHDFGPMLRGQLGYVYTRWPGKNFTGGEFPAGASFSDFSLTGLYVGLKVRFLEDSRIHPFVLGNLGVVRLSSVDVNVGGVTSPYWGQTYRDYIELGTGLEYRFTREVAVYVDLRLESFGKPKSENPPISDATGGSSLTGSIGLDLYLF
jgi:hypothetical protein